eukprot:2973479-Amphidinium_carterae.1
MQGWAMNAHRTPKNDVRCGKDAVDLMVKYAEVQHTLLIEGVSIANNIAKKTLGCFVLCQPVDNCRCVTSCLSLLPRTQHSSRLVSKGGTVRTKIAHCAR